MMPLQCNIDAKGKAARLIWGTLILVCGVILLVLWPLRHGGVIAWSVSIAVILAGGFAIFESRAGWCVVRAMGVKTPI
jgi:hypothetical protein